MLRTYPAGNGRFFTLLLFMLLTACSADTPATPVATAPAAMPLTTTAAPTLAVTTTTLGTVPPRIAATPGPDNTLVPVTTSEAVHLDDPMVAQDAALRGLMAADLGISLQDPPINGGLSSIDTLLVDSPGTTAIWAAHTEGPLAGRMAAHEVRLYLLQAGEWRELARVTLEHVVEIAPDSLTAVAVNDVGYWLEIRGNVPPQGECYSLLHYDFSTLASSVQHCHSTFATDGVTDRNGDGRADLRLNVTDDSVLCDGCGVTRPAFEYLSWHEAGFWEPVDIETISTADWPQLAPTNNQMAELAAAGLWQEAANYIGSLTRDNPVVTWNSIIVAEHANALSTASATSRFPLLSHLFAGDYDAAIAELRPYPPELLFADRPEIIIGTPAEPHLNHMAVTIIETTNLALTYNHENAAAQFLRGWGLFLLSQADPDAVLAIEKADALAPTDPLFADSLFYFYNHLNYGG